MLKIKSKLKNRPTIPKAQVRKSISQWKDMFKFNTHGNESDNIKQHLPQPLFQQNSQSKFLSRNISKDEDTNIKMSFNQIKPQFKSKSEAINLVKVNSESNQPEITDKSLFYKDVAIFRFLDNTAQVFSDSSFLNIFYRRTNSPYWRKLDYVQTNIKSKIGIGKPIFIKFYADLDSK